MKKIQYLIFIVSLTLLSCGANDNFIANQNNTNNENTPVDEIRNLLSLGDSYTIGQSVCATCKFPEQLKNKLSTDTFYTIDLNVIAQTGWTTANLKNAIDNQGISSNYDLVTLLIGVNNQYQNIPFSVYETEFPELVQTAITAANGNKDKVIVVSIPDYAYTPFGQNTGNPDTISQEIDMYNDFAESYCQSQDITFVYITDITRNGLEQPELVASDGLHPSELAYAKFVERILPFAIEKID
jgi:lysophospholipase L1-like esterase